MDRKERVFKELGKVLVNFGSLIFASLVLGILLKGDYDRVFILVGGVAFSIIFVTAGIALLSRRE